MADTRADVLEALTWASTAEQRSWDYLDLLLDLLVQAGDA